MWNELVREENSDWKVVGRGKFSEIGNLVLG